MSRTRNAPLLVVVLLCALGSDAFGITRVARRLNMLEFFGSYASPLGSYDGIGPVPIVDGLGRPVEVDAGDLFDPSFSFGVSYGQLRNDHVLMSIGFRYTKIETDQQIDFDPVDLEFNQYDLGINLNYNFMSLNHQWWTPYFGAGLNAGFTTASAKGYDSESDITVALSMNFGADVSLWSDQKGRSMVTLSSVNSWNIVASDDRPRYLQLGGGIKYWFRP